MFNSNWAHGSSFNTTNWRQNLDQKVKTSGDKRPSGFGTQLGKVINDQTVINDQQQERSLQNKLKNLDQKVKTIWRQKTFWVRDTIREGNQLSDSNQWPPNSIQLNKLKKLGSKSQKSIIRRQKTLWVQDTIREGNQYDQTVINVYSLSSSFNRTNRKN